MPVVLAVVAVAATAYSISEQRQAAKEQKKANEAQNRITERRNSKERLDAIRKARVQAAEATNIGAIGGFSTDSSGAAGVTGSIVSQTEANKNFLAQNSQDSAAAFKASQRAIDFTTSANTASGVASLSMAGLSAFGSPAKPGTSGGSGGK